MSERLPRDKWPWWAQLSVVGVLNRSRTALLVGAGFSLASGAVLIALGLWLDRPYYAVLGLIGPFVASYGWLAIRWIDRHGSWDDLKR